jgi:hypothetical protein
MTRSELLDVVYRFYPRGLPHMQRSHVPPGELHYKDTEEYVRLVGASARGRREYATWKAMIGRLGDRYSLQNESLGLFGDGCVPAYSARIWLREETARPADAFSAWVERFRGWLPRLPSNVGVSIGRYGQLWPPPLHASTKPEPPTSVALTFHVSLLGPYYGIHLPGIPEEEPVVPEIVREIEATYPGYQPIPPELGNEVVPDVDDAGKPYGEATIYTCLFSHAWTWVDSA